MAKSISDQLSMFPLMTSEASPSATSSPGLADGDMPYVSPDGRMIGRSGPARARASRSQSQAREPVQTIQGTCGLTSIASSPPSGPLSSWENKLRARLGMVGSTECALIWKEKATPAGASISRLARWTPPTSDSGFIGSPWPTPCSSDDRDRGRWENPAIQRRVELGKQIMLSMLAQGPMVAATWPTPMAMDHWMTNNIRTDGRQKQLPNVVAEYRATTWPTPITNDATGSTHCYGKVKPDGSRDKILKLPGMVQATWPTPTTPSGGRTAPEGTTTTGIKPDGTKTQVTLEHVTRLSGQTTSGSPAPTANRGALNPAFPCWLMGFPTEWDDCAPTATPSSRKSRQKS